MERIATGIKGIDDMSQGGFPKKTVNLIRGPTGSAKSLFGLQFIEEGVKKSERGLFLSIEEGRENMLRAVRSFDLDKNIYDNGQAYMIDYGEIRRGEAEDLLISFKDLQEFLDNFLQSENIKRLVIDSISAVSLYYSSPEKLRKNLFEFCRFLKDKEVVTILISENEKPGSGIEGFVTDSVLNLGYENFNGEFRRTIKITKMRFTKHDPYQHPFLIMDDGIDVSVDEIIR